METIALSSKLVLLERIDSKITTLAVFGSAINQIEHVVSAIKTQIDLISNIQNGEMS